MCFLSALRKQRWQHDPHSPQGHYRIFQRAMKTHNTKRIYQVRCKSGSIGWRTRLQNNYRDFDEWEHNSDLWGLASRLGYGTAKAAWACNPVVEGSANAGDFRVFSK